MLTYIGVLTVYRKGGAVYPPKASPCPDTWTSSVTVSDSCKIPTLGSPNTGSMYDSSSKALLLKSNTTPGLNTSDNYINFKNSDWTKGGVSAICGQKSWAIKNNITWDGVTNYNKC